MKRSILPTLLPAHQQALLPTRRSAAQSAVQSVLHSVLHSVLLSAIVQSLLWIFLLSISGSLQAQNSLEAVLKEIETQNLSLKALRMQADAEKIGNKTSLFLQDPEVAFHYLWGNPSGMGNRTDFSIQQAFNLPPVYRLQQQIAGLKNEQAELVYQKALLEVRHLTSTLCYQLIYTHAMMGELGKRAAHAEELAVMYKAKLERGESSLPDYNKAQLSRLQATQAVERLRIEKNQLLAQLAQLNGGESIAIPDTLFPVRTLPSEFSEWYREAAGENPLLGWLQKEVEIGQKEARLSRARSLPTWHTGYMSESVPGESFRGVELGMSIPLWENKNQVKYAEAAAKARESSSDNRKQQFYLQLKALHEKAISLKQSAENYRSQLQLLDHTPLLRKALNAGQISLIEYLTELSLYYEGVATRFELERDFYLAVAELDYPHSF